MEISNPQFFIHMKGLPAEETEEFLDLVGWERRKCIEGVYIDDIYIPGWLYFHLNHWWIRVDQEDAVGNVHRIESLPALRDNEWIRSEHFENCRKYKKAYLEFGARQGGKSEFEASYIGYSALLYENGQNIIVGSNSKDLDMLKDKIDFGLKRIWKGLYTPRLDKTWRGNQVRLGYKEVDGEDVIWSTILIRNTDEGKNTEVTAGTTAKSYVYDEAGKAPWMKSFEAAKPAFSSDFGLRAIPIVVGCVCAGTKVWDNTGNLINIEDLIPENGILGYSGKSVSKERITYWQPPAKKQCYRITTTTGRALECSEDHPILIRERHNGKTVSYKKTTAFVETKDLKIGDSIAVIEEVPVWGTKKMYEPRLMGWLVGDGTYGESGYKYYKKDGSITDVRCASTTLCNADPEIWKYVESKFRVSNSSEPVPTKDGRTLRKCRISGLTDYTKAIGISGQTKDDKRLPKDIHSYCKEDVCEFIGGYYDADGCSYFNEKTGEAFLKITSANLEILKELQILLQKIGVHGNIIYEKPNFNNPKTTRGHYNLIIKDKISYINFAENISFFIRYKQEKLLLGLEKFKKQKRSRFVTPIHGVRFERIKFIEDIGFKNVYNLTAGNTNTYIANGIITHNTGGSFDRGADAERVYYNPEANGFLGVEDPVTGKSTGLFMSGLYRREFKYETTLADFLRKERGASIPKGSELELIPMKVSDKERALDAILKERELKKRDPDQSEYLKVIMYSPLTPEECFMRKSNSIFNTVAAKTQQQKLYNNAIKGSNVFLSYDGDKIVFDYTMKLPISSFKHNPNDDLDAPIQVWEFPIENPPYGLYIAGVDPYRHTSSKYSDSLGAVYIFKRISNILDETKYQYRFVASYVARPESKDKWNEQSRLLIKWYNARTLCENDEMSFIEYMKSKGDERFLERQPQWLQEIVPTTTVRREFGVHSSEKIIEYRDACLKKYLDETIRIEKDEEGSVIKEVTGVSYVNDPLLLEEIIKHDPDDPKWNGDRIVAAGLALTLAYHLDPIIGYASAKDDKLDSYFNREKRSMKSSIIPKSPKINRGNQINRLKHLLGKR